MSEVMETTIEQNMQDRYKSARERLGRPFTSQVVVVPRASVPAAVLPSWPDFNEQPEREVFKQSPKKAPAGMKRVKANMVWATQTVAVPVASFGEWGDSSVDDKMTIINSRWRMIMKEVCAKHEVGVLEIRSHRRAYNLTKARHELFYRLKAETALSLSQIGQRVGDFDHTTVISGIKAHAKRIADGTAL